MVNRDVGQNRKQYDWRGAAKSAGFEQQIEAGMGTEPMIDEKHVVCARANRVQSRVVFIDPGQLIVLVWDLREEIFDEKKVILFVVDEQYAGLS
jgi:hypothetical protein